MQDELQTPTAYDLLRVWESGQNKHPVEQALALLQAALPEQPPEALAALNLEARDRLLLMLREKLSGPELELLVDCPECSETLEIQVQVSQLLEAPEPEPDSRPVAAPGATILLRLPTSADMLALEAAGVEGALVALLERCVVSVVETSGAALPGLTPDMLPAVAIALRNRMPLANLSFGLTCPGCEHAWTSAMEIPEVLWTEVEAEVRRVQVEVGLLAGAYGWSEEAILKMSRVRRQGYLEQLNQ